MTQHKILQNQSLSEYDAKTRNLHSVPLAQNIILIRDEAQESTAIRMRWALSDVVNRLFTALNLKT